jgi:ribosomal protein S14
MRNKKIVEITDFRYRYKVYKLEKSFCALRAIALNSKIQSEFRIFAKYMLYYLSSKNKFPNNFKNRCLLTGRARSILPFFKLSRIEFRRLAKQNYLIGVHKSSW